MSNLTKTRLEAIIEAIGQRLACASETDISREEYEKARDWAQAQLDRRRVVKPIPPGPWVDPHQRGAEPLEPTSSFITVGIDFAHDPNSPKDGERDSEPNDCPDPHPIRFQGRTA